MRILIANVRFKSLHDQTYNDGLALRDAGHDVHHVDIERRISRSTAAARQIWSSAIWHLIRGEARAFDADLIHIQETGWALGPTAIRAASSTGLPVVAELHERLLMGLRALIDDQHNDSFVQTMPLVAGNLLHRRWTWQREVDVLVAANVASRQRFVDAWWPSALIEVRTDRADARWLDHVYDIATRRRRSRGSLRQPHTSRAWNSD